MTRTGKTRVDIDSPGRLPVSMGGSTAFAIGQAAKKAIESTRLDDAAAERELLGAINYLAAAVLVIRRRGGAR